MQEVLFRRFWWVPASLLCGLTVFLGFSARQDTFRPLLLGYGAFFLLCLWLFHSAKSEGDIRCWLRVSILLRCILLFAFPQLSDDVYRFLWDGYLLSSGNNPYGMSPFEWLWAEGKPEGLGISLYDQLNSRHYATVYPPFAQLSFALAVLAGGQSWYWSAFFLKLILLASELLTLWLLPRLLGASGLPSKNVLLYALNPLVILEGVGNLHYEVVVVAFVLLGVFLWYRNRHTLAALCMALAVAVKLLPLIFLPFWFRRADNGQLMRFYGISGALLLLFFVPAIAGVHLTHPFGSLLLFFQNFEFNAGIFNLFKWIGIWITGYNPIKSVGALFALQIFAGILIGAWVQRDLSIRGLFRNMMFGLSLYLFLSTTVHPWYLIPLLAFSTFTTFRYPLLWTGLAVLSYSHYMSVPFRAHYGLLALEYLPVFALFAMELRRFRT
jgi:hypothetical protein